MKAVARILIVIFILASASMTGCNRRVAVPRTIPVLDSVSTSTHNSSIFEDKPGTPDSAIIRALLHCDSLGNVYISTIAQLQGKVVNQAVTMQGNTLQVAASSRTREIKESIHKDSVRTEYKDKPVPYPVETITNRLTSWQSFQIWTGRIVLIALIIWLAIHFAGNKLSFISKLFKS